MNNESDSEELLLTANDTHYSQILCELWGDYLKFLQLGMAASGFTVFAIGQFLNVVAIPYFNIAVVVKASVILAGIAGISFGFCRWLTQILMERQVYGPRKAAEYYFMRTETRKPNALRYSPATLSFFYRVNDAFKYIGAVTLLLSWIAIVIVLFTQVDIKSSSIQPSSKTENSTLFP